MKKRVFSTAMAAVLAANMFAAVPFAVSADDSAAEGIIVNIDAEDYLAACAANSVTVSDIKLYASAFDGSQVTDFVIGVNNKIAAYPSDVWTDYLDKYNQTTENGVAVNYKEVPAVKGANLIYNTLKADYIQLWVDEFEKAGVDSWLSFAMNDITDGTEATSYLHSDFFHANPTLRRVHLTRTNQKYQYAMDYSNKAVRDNMLSLIDEALGRYDASGIELDFTNSIWLFSNGGEYRGMAYINDFMREVDKLTAKYAAKRGHEVKVAVRVANDIQTNYDFGLDVAAWAAEGLVDRVCPSSQEIADSDIPVKYWDTLLTPYGVDLAPCVTATIQSRPDSPRKVTQDLETLAGYSANIFSQGADKVYIADFGIADRIRSADKTATVAATDPIDTPKALWNAVNVVGSMDTLMKTNRRVVLTYSDILQLWRNTDAQLSKTIAKGKTAVIMIPVGDIPADATATFNFSVNNVMHTQGISVPQVYINAVKSKMTGAVKDDNHKFITDYIVSYEIPTDVYDEGHFLAEITHRADTSNSLIINYAEVYIKVN